MNDYSVIAEAYDRYINSFELTPWYNYLKKLSGLKSIKGAEILDLACGSGSLGMFFLRDGAKLTGVDISEDMLGIFDQNAFKLKLSPVLLKCDMSEYRPKVKFDFIYSACDSVNYLSEEGVNKLFCNVAELLKPEAVFAFDILNPNKNFESESFEIDERTTLKFERIVKDNYLLSDLLLETDKGISNESHKQSLFTLDFVEEVAACNGLKVHKEYDFLTFGRCTEDSDKCQIVLRKRQ